MASDPAKLEMRRFGDIAKVVHGWPFESAYFTVEDSKLPIVVSIGNFNYTGGFRFGSTEIKRYSGTYPKEYELSPGDLLLIMTCQTTGGEILGVPARVPSDGKTYLHNQRIGKVVVSDPQSVDVGFLYYVTLSKSFNQQLFASASGSKILHTSPGRIESASIPLPPIAEQKRIAHILGTMDDKIELNRRMNATLEAMARTLFQSWFVDFDPVRAKSQTRRGVAAVQTPAGMDPATAALFPSEFEDSELGEIPKGWQVCPLGDYLDVLETGRRPKGGVSGITIGVPSVGAESIWGIGKFDFGKTKFVPEDFYERTSAGRVLHNDVLLYKDGGKPGVFKPRVGMFGHAFPFDRFCINEHVFRMRSTALGQFFLFFTVSHRRVLEDYANKGGKAAIPGINQVDARSVPILVPSKNVLDAFDKTAEPICDRILQNAKQSRILAALRDALLPKLLSGHIAADEVSAFEGSTQCP